MYTAHHFQEIKVHAFMHGTVSLVLSEVFKIKGYELFKI